MVPKGMIEPGEDPLDAAIREFREETGLEPPPVTRALTPLRQAGGKAVLCWAAEGELDITAFAPSHFEMEWPPRSGRRSSFPEIDRLVYLAAQDALARILPSQAPLLHEALSFVGEGA
jgi:predicted NUDIX family NTP pyrophosphohydrolase